MKSSDLTLKLAASTTKTELKAAQNEIVKLQAFSSKYFRGNSHFEDEDTQNYLVSS